MTLEIVKVNSFIRGYHEYMIEWEPTPEDVYGLMREPNNIKDSNAIAVIKEKSCEVELQAPDIHPNNLNDKFEVIGHIPKLMAIWVSKLASK